MLSVADEHLRRFNDRAVLKLFGQELEDETYAICKADMLIRGQDPANIANGDTLVIDKHPQQSFEYMLSNPPYGVEWKPAEAAVRKEHSLGAKGRYAPGLPAIRDWQMLFSLHLLSKMQAFKNGKGGSRIAVVHNGSPLFTGDTGGGESKIRRYILENDYLNCIAAMPTDLFYNTNITTYLWFISNRKPPQHQGKVLLLDASGMAVLLKKNLGKKRREFTADCMARITRAYHEHTALDWTEPKADGDTSPARKLKAKLLPAEHFFYRKLTIERPLRQRFDITADALAALQADAAYAKLPAAQASALLASLQALLDKSLKGSKPDADVFPPSYASAELFRAALNTASQQTPISEVLKAKTLELARKACGTRDASAQPISNEKGDVLTDAELRDAEYVPYGEDVRAYFAKEVLPHWPDAWINEAVTDAKDGKLGMVGTEINFNREFYQYTPPRSRQAIQQDIERMEQQFMALLKEVTTAAQGTA
jgi:type I restriction enzyme M protein